MAQPVETIAVTTPTCVMCGRTSTLNVPREGFKKMAEGALIQNALPELSPEEREMLINGTHPDCFDKLFPPEDDE